MVSEYVVFLIQQTNNRVLWRGASEHLTCTRAARGLSPTSDSGHFSVELSHFFTRFPLGYRKNTFEQAMPSVLILWGPIP